MAEHQVLFCPFCRESFEGCTRCPAHELPLVGFDALTPDEHDADPLDADPLDVDDARRLPPGDRPLALLDPQRGRGLVALAALLDALALALPVVSLEPGRSLRTYELARALPALWSLALVSFTLLFVLVRRRTPRALASLRVLVPLLALVTLGVVGWLRLKLGEAALAWGPATALVTIAAVPMMIAGVRLGGRLDQ